MPAQGSGVISVCIVVLVDRGIELLRSGFGDTAAFPRDSSARNEPSCAYQATTHRWTAYSSDLRACRILVIRGRPASCWPSVLGKDLSGKKERGEWLRQHMRERLPMRTFAAMAVRIRYDTSPILPKHFTSAVGDTQLTSAYVAQAVGLPFRSYGMYSSYSSSAARGLNVRHGQSGIEYFRVRDRSYRTSRPFVALYNPTHMDLSRLSTQQT